MFHSYVKLPEGRLSRLSTLVPITTLLDIIHSEYGMYGMVANTELTTHNTLYF